MTLEQAQELLAIYGINIPSFMLGGLLEQVSELDECLSKHYTEATATLIKGYLLALIGLGFGDKYVSSQTAPSGASQSFRYQSVGDRYRGLLGLLQGIDKRGCTLGAIPPNPEKSYTAGMWSVTAGCMSDD